MWQFDHNGKRHEGTDKPTRRKLFIISPVELQTSEEYLKNKMVQSVQYLSNSVKLKKVNIQKSTAKNIKKTMV